MNATWIAPRDLDVGVSWYRRTPAVSTSTNAGSAAGGYAAAAGAWAAACRVGLATRLTTVVPPRSASTTAAAANSRDLRPVSLRSSRR